MKNLQELETERKELFAQMDRHETAEKRAEWLKQVKENERETIKLKTAQQLERVNREQAEKRKFAQLAWDAEQPTEDITCNDGSLHKVKAKKYPKLAAIQYLRICEFKDGKTTELSINGHKFRMFSIKYNGYNEPATYTRPETFAAFLELNNIQPADITAEKFAEFTQKLDEATAKVKQAMEEYNQEREKLNCYQYQHIGLVNKNSTHFYTYEAKKGY